ncbi:DUF317 domain-containing protein [Streptomyces sp. NPDC091292]|uniref:DUF317 domain-containing protein n=1 Tax=Streptomyces sp. NPDC091292 TaxID=3365991 RepID=UPI00382F435B
MRVSKQQLTAFADKLACQIPFDTSPRHLAGPGDARHVTHGLATAGWICTSDPLSAEIILRSPDHRLTLQFDPQSATSAWWRLRAETTDSERGWYAEFGELVPAEILCHATDALVTPPPSKQQAPWEVLGSAGWLLDEANRAARSPDAMCHIEQGRDRDVMSWRIETLPSGHPYSDGPRIWHAWFDTRTPSCLVTAFITGLVDTAPLQRGMYERLGHYSTVQERSPLSPEQVAAAHTARVDRIRVQARAARRQQPSSAAAAPTTTGAARPAASLTPVRGR